MVKKCAVVWNYYNKKVDGSQVIAFCKFCDHSYVQNAARMERHLERCLKCPGEVRRQFIQVRNDKRNKTNVLGVKVNDKQRKRESSLERVTDLELEGLDDWHYKNRYYTDEMSETIQQCDAKIVIQSKDKSRTSHDSNVQSIRGDGSAKIRTRDSSQTDAEMAKIGNFQTLDIMKLIVTTQMYIFKRFRRWIRRT